MCPLVPPQNQHIFNNHLNLKTVLAPNIELREHRKQWHTGNKCLVLPITTFKMIGVVITLWPVNSGENTAGVRCAMRTVSSVHCSTCLSFSCKKF